MVLVAGVCTALFFAPHHVRGPDAIGEFSLFDIFLDSCSSIADLQTPKALLFAAIIIAASLSLFYPMALVAMLRWMPPAAGRAGGPLLVIGGVMVVLAALVNWVAMSMSQMSFGFGGSSPLAPETALLWIIPLFQAAAAAVSFAVGLSARCSAWAVRAISAS
jgi:hypothetical protein